MAVSPLVSATIQSALLNATSNILAQAITAYRTEKPLTIDWFPVFQFLILQVVSTPPNFLWQEFLESTFPANKASTKVTPTAAAIASASANDDKALDREEREGQLVEVAAPLSKRNTAAKFALDQTIGAAVNTLLFSLFMHSVRAAMVATTGGSAPRLEYARVDWRVVAQRAGSEFWPIMTAGWRFWPFVSAFNFGIVKSVEVRNLVGSLAGMAWGVYMSLVAAA